MRHKYITDAFPRYFVFGEHSDGMVDVADSSSSTIVTMSLDNANKVITDRDKLINKLCEMAEAFEQADGVAFERFWYASI